MLIPAASVKAPPNLESEQLFPTLKQKTALAPKSNPQGQDEERQVISINGCLDGYIVVTYPMICWYLTSLSRVMVTPTVLEEFSHVSVLLSRRRPSGWSLQLFRIFFSFVMSSLRYFWVHQNTFFGERVQCFN